MKITKKVKKGFTLIELLVVIAIMGALGAVGYVAILSFSNSGAKQAAKQNIGQLVTAAKAFQSTYNTFPCDSTADRLEGRIGSNGELKGDTANPYFRQLFAKKDTVKESTFFAELPGILEGDEKVANGECLRPGENAFAYVTQKVAATDTAKTKPGNRRKAKDAAAPQRQAITSGPLFFCCVDRNLTGPVTGDQLTFDMEAFKGYAIVANTDNSTVDLDDESLVADPANEAIGRISPDFEVKVFGENSQGESKASLYEILPPAR